MPSLVFLLFFWLEFMHNFCVSFYFNVLNICTIPSTAVEGGGRAGEREMFTHKNTLAFWKKNCGKKEFSMSSRVFFVRGGRVERSGWVLKEVVRAVC